MKSPASVFSFLLLLFPVALLISGCTREEYMRPDERWPDRPGVRIAADSALAEALHGMRLGIDNVDSTLKLSVAFMGPGEIGPKGSAGGFGILLYGTTGDSTDILPVAIAPAEPPVLLAGDPLVLLASAHSPLAAPVDLAGAGIATIAVVAPEQPEGKLAELAIRRLGLRDTLAARLLTAGSGRDLIDMITSGRAAVGIINGTEARRFGGRTKIIDTLRLPRAVSGRDAIPMIRYYALSLPGAPDSGATARMMAWLVTPEFQRSFNHNGFIRRDSILAREGRGN